MDSIRIAHRIVGVAALVCIPIVWAFGLADVPSMATVKASHTADIVGVWIFTWALIWVASAAACAVAWICWSLDRQADRTVRAVGPKAA